MKRRNISGLTAMVMAACMILPTTAYAAGPEGEKEDAVITEQVSGEEDAVSMREEAGSDQAGDSELVAVTDYNSFLSGYICSTALLKVSKTNLI